jgi:hypothetical protein
MRKTILIVLALCSPLIAQPANAGDQDQDTIRWLKYDDIPKFFTPYIELEEGESVKNVRAAVVRLREATPPSDNDALLIYNFNWMSCGSGGCSVDIFIDTPDGGMEEVGYIFGVVGADEEESPDPGISLGKFYTNGMRNLRLQDRVTYVWNGQTYQIK